MISTLYLCYFGLREPLVQTQVLPYLREIVKGGVIVHLLTFEPELKEKWTREEIGSTKATLATEGIEWHVLKYHKKPSALATLYDVCRGAFFARALARKKNIEVFHGRVHIPMLMGWIANKMLKQKPKMLFDIRGFFPEEYIDAGVWKNNSVIYTLAKFFERKLLRDADGFVVLTEKARELLFQESCETGFDRFRRPVEVIPCCVDMDRFKIANRKSRLEMRERLGIENRFVVAYVGSFGGFYMTRETAFFFGVAKEKNPDTFALILTQSSTEMIEPLLKEQGLDENDYFIQKVKPDDIPLYLSAADLAISFIKPSYSKLASSPTKNAEYLACGLPMIVNSKVGDVAEIVIEDGTGVVIGDFSQETFEDALKRISKMLGNKKELNEKCRRSAKKRFDMEKIGGERYRRIYSALTQQLKGY